MGKFIKRTHTVRMPILHDNYPYKPGDEITFGKHVTSEEIQELIDLGYLDGPNADELDAMRLVNEKLTGVKNTPYEEQMKLYRQYLRSREEQRAKEMSEARIKEDATGARLVNTDEALAKARAALKPESASEIAATEEAEAGEETEE